MKYFGTDGFRGEAGRVLTADHAYKIGRYLGWYYNQNHKGRIVIGKDTRRSSYMFEYSLVAGIIASGANAYLLHVTTTPSVAYVVRTEDFDCGVMVSASHNPYYDNGIKIMDGNGHKMAASVEEEIERYIDGEIDELPFATGEDVGIATDYAIGRNRYIGYLISLATRSYSGKRIGLDCSNGTFSRYSSPGKYFLPNFLSISSCLGASVISLRRPKQITLLTWYHQSPGSFSGSPRTVKHALSQALSESILCPCMALWK